MTECEILRTCIFFHNKMADMPSTAEALKLRYCFTDNSKCARYMVLQALGRGQVPINLYPGQTDKALGLIASH